MDSEFFRICMRYFILATLVVVCMQHCETAYSFAGFEKKLVYYPINTKMNPLRLELNGTFQDTYFYSLDGVKLNAWYIKAQECKPTIIYCHGQGENISLWQSVAQSLIDNGYGVFMLDYRGHGRSKGVPSETGLYTDLESAIKYLKDYENVSQKDVIVWGRSLGGAVVADIASRGCFKGVILESTFTNIRDEAIHLTSTGILESKLGLWGRLATRFVKFFPMTEKFDTENKIFKIESPLLIAHSVNDNTVPVKMAYQLAKRNPACELFISKNGSHHESEWFIDKALEFIGKLN